MEKTLLNQKPANHADLAALVLDHLRDIAQEIRDEEWNGYRQFWDPIEKKRCGKPKTENESRDILLGFLKGRLRRMSIDTQKEKEHSDEKRADISVWFGQNGGINIPIEIKKDRSRDLWRAIHEQLIPRYTRDPGANGYGIYLVFWFGGEGMPVPPDGRRRPRSAMELEERLIDSIEPEDQHQIRVCVFDCACPEKLRA